MNVGIVGSGNVGATLGRAWARAGHSVLFSYSRSREKLEGLARETGGRAGTPADAAAFGEVVLLSPPWSLLDDALEEAGSLGDRIVIDTTNPYLHGSLALALYGESSAAEEIAARLPGARLVKAYNTLPALLLMAGGEADRRLAMFLAGDDPAAKRVVERLICDSGFEPVDAGPLVRARELEPRGSLFGQPLSAQAARELVEALGCPPQGP